MRETDVSTGKTKTLGCNILSGTFVKQNKHVNRVASTQFLFLEAFDMDPRKVDRESRSEALGRHYDAIALRRQRQGGGHDLRHGE